MFIIRVLLLLCLLLFVCCFAGCVELVNFMPLEYIACLLWWCVVVGFSGLFRLVNVVVGDA